jgi:hypothetical protein
MKAMKTNIIGTGIAMAIALAAWLPSNINAAEDHSKMKGGEHMMSLTKITTKTEGEALKPGDSMAMVCTKCKSVAVQNVTTEKGHIKLMTVGEKHLCAGCDSVITVVGVGKGAKEVLKHTCGKCGDTSAFCCATKPGAGETKGMDKEKK